MISYVKFGIYAQFFFAFFLFALAEDEIGFDLKAQQRTDSEDSGKWSMYFLDRLPVTCLSDSSAAISQFQLQIDPDTSNTQWWYQYTCASGGFSPVITNQSSLAAYDNANTQNNVEWLDRIHDVDCSSVNGVISSFVLVNQVDPDENGYKFTCSTFGSSPLTCREVHNTYTSVGSSKGSNANYLALQNVECEANEAIQKFFYEDAYPAATGGYVYTCCQYTPSCSAGYGYDTTTGNCNMCTENMYSTGGTEACTACKEGSTSSAGASSCSLSCDPGFGFMADLNECTICYAGTYSLGGSSPCTYCDWGYTSLDQATACYSMDEVPPSYDTEEEEDDIESSSESYSPAVTDNSQTQVDDWYYLANTIESDGSCSYIDSKHGVAFDLGPLKVYMDDESSYVYENKGDINEYNYVWNVCAPVTTASLPDQCIDATTSTRPHAVYQYRDNTECYVLGKFYAMKNETYSLIDESNPAKGITITYEKGEKCNSNVFRDSVIDIYCANVEVEVDKAQEPRTCSYHMIMSSYYGCPTTCAITAKGLCDSSGSCDYDSSTKSAYCKCDDGYTGGDCSVQNSLIATLSNYVPYYVYSSPSTFSTLQLVLLIVVAAAVFGLCVGIGLMGYRQITWRSREGYSMLSTKDDALISGMNL